jgi:peptidoglycan/LPS O-acetylase OafA/YrhL
MLGGLMGAALRPARDRPCGTLERWAPAVVLLGLATACVVVAFVRDDPPVTFPAPALVVV